MGGWTTRFFVALNAVSPRLADALVMKRYGATMAHFFNRPDGEEFAWPPARPRSKWGRTLGILLIMLSFLAYGVLISLPVLPLEGKRSWRWPRCWSAWARRPSGSAACLSARSWSRVIGAILTRAIGVCVGARALIVANVGRNRGVRDGLPRNRRR